jgi:hypothetical protein
MTGGGEGEQLADCVILGLNIDNIDEVAPIARLYDLNPKAESSVSGAPPGLYGLVSTNKDQGGLYSAGTGRNALLQGHIEPRWPDSGLGAGAGNNSFFLESAVPYGGAALSFGRDTVSGKVILRGYAFDAQRITTIKLVLGTVTVNVVNAQNANGSLIPSANAGVIDRLTLDGHWAEWSYVWDTETIPGGLVGTNLAVELVVNDASSRASGPNRNEVFRHPSLTGAGNLGTNNGSGSYAGADGGYNRIMVDRAPYITGLSRDTGAGFNTLRSKQGWYAFRREEKLIVSGYNLSTGGGPTLSLSGTALTVNAQNTHELVVNSLPSNVTSGSLLLSASGGVTAVNNRNNNANFWNKELSPYQEGSDLWNDDRFAHIWQSNNSAAGTAANANRGYFAGSSKPVHPAMTVNPASGVLHASWSEYKDSRAWRGTNNGSAVNIYSIYDPPEHTDIAIDRNTGDPNKTPTIAYNANVYSNGGWTIGNTGGMQVWDNLAPSLSGYAPGGSAYMAESLVHDQMLAQFINERVVTRNSHIHVSYYDTDTRSLKYWYNYSGYSRNGSEYTNNLAWTPGTPPGQLRPQRWINIDGGFDGNDMNGENRVVGYISGGTAGNSANAASARNGGAFGPWSSAAGEYSAIDLTNQGYPAIVYYDIEGMTVKLAYTTQELPLAAANWKRQNVFAPGDPNRDFSGKYISLRINPANNEMHIAFNRTNTNDLVYVKGTRSADGSYTFGQSVIVDSVGSAGRWVDLSLDSSGNPWISYLDISRVDFYDGLKMAYYNPGQFSAPSADSNGRVTTGWEYMHVPLGFYVTDARTSIENWDSGAQFWSAAIGYASDDYFRIAYYTKP